MINLLEPWVLLVMVAAMMSAFLFARAAWTSLRVVRRFEISRATEGQLALERRFELASVYVRVAAAAQFATLLLTVIAADRLSKSVRGAMCAYGVFQSEPGGFRALAMSFAVAIAAGVLSELYALNGRVRGMELVRPLAILTVLILPLTIVDFAMTSAFLGRLDLGVVASCCSAQFDSAAASYSFVAGPRVLAVRGALIAIGACLVVAALARRSPRGQLIVAAGACSLVALPLALASAVLEVAPHAFELPQHVCPFCLLRSDVFYLGYPLFVAILLAVIWSVGAAAGALISRGAESRAALAPFARQRLSRAAVAWIVAVAVGAAPVLRYAIVSGGAPLFQ